MDENKIIWNKKKLTFPEIIPNPKIYLKID